MTRIRHIATRFALILAVAAVLPLVAYGVISLMSLQRGTRESIVAGNLNVAARAAEEIGRYLTGHAEILKALAADLQDTGLERWQQDRILKNYVLQFRELRELTLLEESGDILASSRIGRPRVAAPQGNGTTIAGVSMSPVRVDDDLLPTSTFTVRLRRLNEPAGWLVGELALEELWRMVDRIRIGEHGFALVVSPDATLIAHGDPDSKALVAQARNMSGHPLVAPRPAGPSWQEYVDESGRRRLAVAARMKTANWTIIVEQPTSEAYANARALQRQLAIAAVSALLIMVSVGLVFGRRFIAPILSLQRATQAVAEGRLDTRVGSGSEDELGQLGRSFNAMADRLVQLQESLRREERQATFGRVAVGLAHDLSHPIQNIANSTRLLVRDDIEPESRAALHRTIERELASLKRFLDDLRNLVKPRPLERFAMDLNSVVAEIVESMRPEGDQSGVLVVGRHLGAPLTIDGDRFALGRVFRNLVTNAIQATAPGGEVTITTTRVGDFVEATVADTGSGIPADRLTGIFEDFVTTKRRGLGLGLAISKRIVEQLEGAIDVRSEVGCGTSFTVRLPVSRAATQAAAS
jgi:signal transduction histidine kinase